LQLAFVAVADVAIVAFVDILKTTKMFLLPKLFCLVSTMPIFYSFFLFLNLPFQSKVYTCSLSMHLLNRIALV